MKWLRVRNLTGSPAHEADVATFYYPALVILMLSGCASTTTAPATAKAAVPEAPCKADVPARPVFASETLTGDEDIWVIGTQLWAERKARRAYELQLEIIAAKCTGSPALP